MRKKIAYTGLWTFPLALVVLITGTCYFDNFTLQLLPALIMVSLLPAFYIWSLNVSAKNNGKEQFGLMDAFNRANDPYYLKTLKNKAMYPVVHKSMLSPEPDGVILGKYHGKYVRVPAGWDGHYFVLGGSGSGKSSSVIIPTLLALQQIPKHVRPGIIAVDIKGELSQKSTKHDDPDVKIIDPGDRYTWGFDPFGSLGETFSSQELLEVAQSITDALIPMTADGKDRFWVTSARSMLEGFTIYFYKNGSRTIPEIIDRISGAPVDKIVSEAVSKSNPNTIEYRDLITFEGMAPETLSGIYAEMKSHLTIFSNDQNVRYCFKENPNRIKAVDIEKGYSFFIRIKDEKLSAYEGVLKIILNLFSKHLQARDELADNRKVIMIIDELGRLVSSGPLNSILGGLQVLRSKNVSLILASQSLESLLTAYSDAQVTDMFTNCQYKLVLSSSEKAGKFFQANAGSFKEIKKSYSMEKGKKHYSISYEDKDIVQPADLQDLMRKKEVAMITPYGYFRTKACFYFQDEKFSKMVEEMQKKEKAG